MIYSWQNDIKIGSDLLQLVAERKTLSGYSNDGGVVSQNQNTNTVAGSYQLKRGTHLANLALRNDSITGYGPQTTGSASYGYFFSKQIRGNINYGTGFKAPSFNDLYFPDYGNTNLQAEKSKNTEVGLHYESSGLDLHLISPDSFPSRVLISPDSCACPISSLFSLLSIISSFCRLQQIADPFFG